MAPFYVDDFMSQHAGDFIGTFGSFDEPGVKVNRSTRDRKGVELGVFDDKETIIEGLWPHGGKNSLSDTLYVTFNFGIIDEFKVLLGLAPKLPTDPYLFVFARRSERGEDRRNVSAAAAADKKSDQQNPRAANLPRAKLVSLMNH